ncbi:hypothetical protein N8525_00255 [Verrucomicrobiales bacterium]|nr:hypothetical protein [Verrucomicrobiales bacterium]
MHNVPSKFRFPIAEEEIQTRKWLARLSSPVTWAVYGALGLLLYILKPLWWISLILVAVTTLALWYYWRLTGKALGRRILKQVIKESNLKQEDAMSQRLKRLRKSRASDLAITLGKFAELKREIEEEISGGDDVPVSAADVEAIVDALCFGVADELDALAQVQGRLARPDLQITDEQKSELEDHQRELVSGISQAYKTLRETRYNLDAILHPTSLDLPKRDQELGDVVLRLKEETEIAKRVRQRLDQASMKAEKEIR